LNQHDSLRDLVDSARRAAKVGRLDEAARAWEAVSAVAPNHPEALYFFGQRALAAGNAREAAQLLERASAEAPNDAVIPLALAAALRAAGDDNAEVRAYDRALSADPYCYPALLAKASLLERQGNKRSAARIFADALKITPAENRLPADLLKLVQRARVAVSENTEALSAFVDAKIGKVRVNHGAARLDRFDECKDGMTGRKRIYTQQPVMLNFPRLPAIQFYDGDQFPWLADLEAKTDAIEGELTALLRDSAPGFRPYIDMPDTALLLGRRQADRRALPTLPADGGDARCHAARKRPGLCAGGILLLAHARHAHSAPHGGHEYTAHRALGARRARRLHVPRRQRNPRLEAWQSLGLRRHDRARSLQRKWPDARRSHL
jgi:tetratricopeptide (TPR) repeat protein